MIITPNAPPLAPAKIIRINAINPYRRFNKDVSDEIGFPLDPDVPDVVPREVNGLRLAIIDVTTPIMIKSTNPTINPIAIIIIKDRIVPLTIPTF